MISGVAKVGALRGTAGPDDAVAHPDVVRLEIAGVDLQRRVVGHARQGDRAVVGVLRRARLHGGLGRDTPFGVDEGNIQRDTGAIP